MDSTLAPAETSGRRAFTPFGGKPGAIRPIVILAIVAGVICAVSAAFELATGFGWTRPTFVASANHFFLILLLGAAVARPREGLMLSLILLTVNFGTPVRHGISSAPSIYLVAGSTFGFALRMAAGGRLRLSLLPTAAVLCLALSALAGLCAPLLSGTMAESKLQLAQFAGITSMALYLIAPVLALENKVRIDWIVGAMAAATLPLAAGGLAGGTETLFCFSKGADYAPFASAGFRSRGFLPDANLFGIVTAAFLLLSSQSASQHFTRIRIVPAAILFCCAMVILSGSRAGMLSLSLSLGLSAIYCHFQLSMRQFLYGVAPGLALALVAIFLTPAIWSDLPCPGWRSSNQVTFAERNDARTYFLRVVQDSPFAAQAVAAQEEQIYETKAFRREPALEKVISMLPIDRARQLIWQHALIVGFAHPFFGSGLAALSANTPDGWSAHNTILTTFAEQGLVGVIFLSTAVILCYVPTARSLCRRRGDPAHLVPLFIAGFTLMFGSITHDMIRLDLFWGISGVILAAGIHADKHATARRVTRGLPERN